MTKGKMKLGLSRLRSGLKAIMATRRGFVPAAGALILLLSGARAWAQYKPIPNYVGIGAGQQFRNDINNHLSGVTPIAPRLVSLPFAQLPAEQDGQMYWCPDCQQSAPCQGSGSGATAIGTAGQWICLNAVAAGSSFPLNNDVSAGNHHISNVANAGANGQPCVYGQPGCQLGYYTLPTVVGSAGATNNTASQAVNKPAGTAAGDVEIAFLGWQNTSALTPPAGWNQVRLDMAGSRSHAVYWHLAGSSEPSSYTWTIGTSTFLGIVIIDTRGVNTTTPVDVSNWTYSSTQTVTSTPLVASSTSELGLAGIIINAGAPYFQPPTSSGAALTPQFINDQGNPMVPHVYSWPQYNSGNGPAITETQGSGASQGGIEQVLLVPANFATGVPPITGGAEFPKTIFGTSADGSNTINNFSVNSDYNPVAYGADPSGLACSDAAFQAALNAASAAATSAPSIPQIRVPAGKYKICTRWWTGRTRRCRSSGREWDRRRWSTRWATTAI